MAYAVMLRDRPNFRFIRYEELTSSPTEQLNEIGKWLGARAQGVAKEGHLRDQFGVSWEGNSSFAGGSRKQLASRERDLVELLCRPEMLLMGYQANARPDAQSLGFLVSAGLSPADAEIELERLAMVRDGVLQDDVDEWFLSESVFSTLMAGARDG